MRSFGFGVGLLSLGLVIALWTVTAPPEDAARDLLVNRAWADHFPKSQKDLVTWFVPLEVRGKRFGVAQRSSHFAYAGERFVYTRDGERLRLVFQQSERKVELQAKVSKCQAPKPFDLCLDLRAGNESTRLYSKSTWRIPRKDGETAVPAIDLTPPDEASCARCVDGLPELLSPLFR